MARAKTILQNEYPYSITARCINREWFKLNMKVVWDIFSEELYLTSKYFNLQVHSFVLMNNHFHLIATTPDLNIDKCMHYFMKNTSYRLTRAGNRINQTYCGRYYKTILQTHSYYLNAYKYIYQNPVAAKIVCRVEDYPYSTLSGLVGKTKILIPIVEDLILFSSIEETLKWLNEPIKKEKSEAIRWGLKRPYFKPKTCRKKRKSILEKDELV